jgi:hypothetical protein
MGNLGFQEIFLLAVIVGVIIVIVKAATRPRNTTLISNDNSTDDAPSNYQQTVVVTGNQKSVGVAFLLAFFFGPLGLLYVSVTGGILLFIIGIFVGVVTLGYGLIFIWIISIVWAIIAASNSQSNTIISRTNISAQTTSVRNIVNEVPVDKAGLLNQLSQLHSLREKNVITEEIYEKERQLILAKLEK